jgi:hypothetical protein
VSKRLPEDAKLPLKKYTRPEPSTGHDEHVHPPA